MDLALEYSTELGGFDLALAGVDLATDDGLRSAVVVSLFSDARATDEAASLAPDEDRRGFWADSLSEIRGDSTGSLLWILARAKNLPRTRADLEQWGRRALSWLISDGVARGVSVRAVRLERESAALEVVISRPFGPPSEYRFAFLWESV